MSYNRTVGTLRGASVLDIGGLSIRAAGDIKTVIGVSTFDVPYGESGKKDPRVNSVDISITLQPVGLITQALVDFMFSMLSKRIGDSLLGAEDVTCAILPKRGGEALTISSIFVSKPPPLRFKSTETAFGELTLRGILPIDTDWSAVAARFGYQASAAAPSVAAINPSIIPTAAAQLSWGAEAPWQGIKTGEGVTVDWDIKTTDDVVDDDGLVDVYFDTLTPKIKITSPRGLTLKNMLDRMTLQGEGAARGMSMRDNAVDLTVQGITPGTLKAVIPKAQLKQPLNLTQGAMTKWIGDIELEGTEEDANPATVTIVPEA